MDNNRNYIVAIALSVLVLIAWQYFYVSPRVAREHAAQQAKQTQTTTGARAGRRRRLRPAAMATAARRRRRPPGLRQCRPAGRRGAAAGGVHVARGDPEGDRPRADRDARGQRFDQPEGRALRRSQAQRLPRDRRQEEPADHPAQSGAVGARLFRRVRLHRQRQDGRRCRDPTRSGRSSREAS